MLGDRNEKEVTLEELINQKPHQQIEKKQKDKQLIQQLNRKNYQIAILHEVSKPLFTLDTRLGHQLAILQKKLGIDNNLILKQLENISQISVAFHYQTEQLVYLDNLFKAYDQSNIRQKKLVKHQLSQIAMLYSQLEDAQHKSVSLVKQNEFLLNQMQEKCKQILQIYNKGFPQDSLVSAYNKLQIQCQNERINILKQQNQYLTINYHELEVKYSKLKEQFDQQKKLSQKYFQSFKQQSEELKNCLIKIDDLVKIKGILEKKFEEVSQENIQLESMKSQLQTKISKLQNDHKNLKNKFHQIKKIDNEQNQKLNMEIDTLKVQQQSIAKRQKQLFQKNMILERELESIKDTSRKSKRQLEKLRNDFQQTLKMCETYESKISIFIKKQQNMKIIEQEYKEKLDKIIFQKDKAIMQTEQLEKIIEKINTKNKDQSNKQKLAYQKIINSQTEKIKFLEQGRQQFQDNYIQSQLSFKNQIDKLKRQNNYLKQENIKYINNYRSISQNQIVGKLKQIQQRNQSLVKSMNQKQKQWKEQIQHKDQLIRTLEIQNKDMSRNIDKQRNHAREVINQRTQLKSKISILQKQKQCLEDQLLRYKRSIDSKSINEQQQRDWKIRELQQKLSELTLKERTTRQKAIQMLQKYDEAQQKLKIQYENRIKELQIENVKLKNKLRQ